MKKPKILLLDTENSPNLAYIWGKYEQNAIAFKSEWELLSFAYKWIGEKTTKCKARCHYKDKTDKSVTKDLWNLFNEADLIIAHNADQFDIKKAKAKFIEHGFPPPRMYRSIDTLKIVRKHFKFNSNSLNDVCQLLKIGKKADTSGFKTWLGCMAGDKKSWDIMIKYNKQDVVLLERLYKKLLPWIDNHPSVALLGGRGQCPNCGGSSCKKDGIRANHRTMSQQWKCKDCSTYFLTPFKKNLDK